MWFFYYFYFENNYNVEESLLFVEQNINFHKNETETKMKNPKYSFREINHVLQLK